MATSPGGAGEKVKQSRPGAALRVVLSLLIAAGFVWVFREAGLPLMPSAQAFECLNGWWAVGSFVLLAASVAFRTRRWFHLLVPFRRELDREHIFGIGLVGYAAVLIAPLRLGEFVRPYWVSKSQGVGLLQALATVAAERVADGLTVAWLALLALQWARPLSPLPTHLGGIVVPVAAAPSVLWLGAVLFAVALGVMAAFHRYAGLAGKLVRRVLGVLSQTAATRGAGFVLRFGEGFGSLRAALQRPFVSDHAAYWALGLLAQFVLLRAVSLDVSLAQTIVVLGLMALGSLLPAGPGSFGPFQLAGYVGLSLYYPPEVVITNGAVYVFLAYVSQLLVNLLGAGFGLWWMRRAPKVR